ncbi:MAG: hypothetical protein M1813_009671 [Trichoglossum hirsutum]|nr:MAG: hypothetical protein M1813_009671 [Trichoglossum hirsutum]
MPTALVPSGSFHLVSETPKALRRTAREWHDARDQLLHHVREHAVEDRDVNPLQESAIVEVGTLDDLALVDGLRPRAELYTCYRAKWPRGGVGGRGAE